MPGTKVTGRGLRIYPPGQGDGGRRGGRLADSAGAARRLLEPRIAGNTGNAIRLAAGTGATLHLVEPLGFELDEPRLRRAGLDYHDLAHVGPPRPRRAFAALPGARLWAFTTRGHAWHTDIAWRAGDALLFGPEPTGLPQRRSRTRGSPVRCASRCSPGRTLDEPLERRRRRDYEAWRQLGFDGAR